MTGKDVLLEVLTSIEAEKGFPFYQQGSLSDKDSYPESFFTFWNQDTSSTRFYDNDATAAVWDLELYFYSSDPDIVNGIFQEIKPELKAAGFIIDGVGFDVLSDEPSHSGRGIYITYVERG